MLDKHIEEEDNSSQLVAQHKLAVGPYKPADSTLLQHQQQLTFLLLKRRSQLRFQSICQCLDLQVLSLEEQELFRVLVVFFSYNDLLFLFRTSQRCCGLITWFVVWLFLFQLPLSPTILVWMLLRRLIGSLNRWNGTHDPITNSTMLSSCRRRPSRYKLDPPSCRSSLKTTITSFHVGFLMGLDILATEQTLQ